jgi:hypothetical protein
MSDIGRPHGQGDSGQAGKSAQPGESALSVVKDAPPEPSAAETAWRKATLAAQVGKMPGMDTVDTCRMRLLTLRARIETNWPQTGGGVFKRGQGMSREATADIAALLVALPTPLPLRSGGEPEPIIRETDTDMREVSGRAVDAGLALLDGTTLETIYRGHVKMLEDYHPDALEPIIVSNLTVGALVATIIGTLDAISETVMETPGGGKKAASTHKAGNKPGWESKAAPPKAAPPKRGKSVPRI